MSTYLCKASLMFLNLPSDETSSCSLAIVCLVCLLNLSQVFVSRYIELLTKAAQICQDKTGMYLNEFTYVRLQSRVEYGDI